jgi:hypothetical protein
MKTTILIIFSMCFASVTAAQAWHAYRSAKANDTESSQIIASLEKAKSDESDIIEALLSFTKNSAANRSFVLAADPIRKDHAKSVQLIDAQIGAIRARGEKGWRTLSIQLLFGTLSLGALIIFIGSFAFPAWEKRPAVSRKSARKKNTESVEA